MISECCIFEVRPKKCLEVGLNSWYNVIAEIGGTWTLKMEGGGILTPQTGG